MVVMTLPNLLGLVVMRQEIRQEIREYWTGFSRLTPTRQTPRRRTRARREGG